MARLQIRPETGPRARAAHQSGLSDAALTERAADGDSAAFEELYRRHSEASYRVARAVTKNADDAADAVSEAFTKVFVSLPRQSGDGTATQFRPYVLAATRNAAIDILRRRGRSLPSEPEKLDRADSARGPDAAVVFGADAALVMTAMEGLPERWRTILWLTEVEGLAPREAADVLGMTPNGASQLAVRARAGLREAYLQAHLQGSVSKQCAETVPILGAYVAGGLAARDIAKVDQHLAACTACQERITELEDVGDRLRRVVIPFPLAVAGAGGGLAASLGLTGGLAGGGLAGGGIAAGAKALDKAGLALRPLQKPLLYASIGLFALGIMAVAVIGGPKADRPTIDGRPSPVAGAPSPATLDDPEVALAISFGDPIPAPAGGFDPSVLSGAADNDSAGDDGGASGTEPPGPAPAPPAPPPAPEPVANVAAQAGPDGTLGLSLGLGEGSCTGATVLGTSAGCAPAGQPEGNTLTVKTAGSVPGDNEASI